MLKMAAKIDGKTNGCILLWKIQNVSHCWLQTGERIDSPAFIIDALEGTKWSLALYPMGKADKNYVTINIYRHKDCNGPNEIAVNSKFAFLDNDGYFLKENTSNRRYKRDEWAFGISEERIKVFVTDKEAFLPDDTLTVQCTIWKEGETPVKPKDLFARTIWKVKSASFVWKIGKFCTLQPGIRNKFKDDLMDFELVLKKGLDCEKDLVIEGISFDDSIKYFSFNTAVINWEGKNEYRVRHEYFAPDLKKGVLSTLLSTGMLKEKHRYWPNDILSLDCEYLYSTGTVSDQFCSYGIISPNLTKAAVEERNEPCIEQPNIQLVPALVTDLKSMYIDGIFSDIELRTSTRTFRAHKNILSARSFVFCEIISNDMMKENCGHIDITNLDADTVRRMLLYIYTDSLGNMRLENAYKLYEAAYKFEIFSLRDGCFSFLKENMCLTDAHGIVALGYLYTDEDEDLIKALKY